MALRHPRPYLGRIMAFLARFSPFRAVRDLRVFLSYRKPHELWFLLLSIGITTLLIAGFVKDSHMPKPYKRDIIYVENFRADRSIDEIRARLKRDAPIEAKQRADFERRKAERQAQFKRYDDSLRKWGL